MVQVALIGVAVEQRLQRASEHLLHVGFGHEAAVRAHDLQALAVGHVALRHRVVGTPAQTVGTEMFVDRFGHTARWCVGEVPAIGLGESKPRQLHVDILYQRRVAQTARQAYLGVTSGIAQVKALQQAVISNQSSFDSTKLGLEVGVRTSVDLLNARQQVFSARRDLAQALYNYILSRLRLSAAGGVLTVADVQQVNDWLKLATKP